jgi:hypothetical protein
VTALKKTATKEISSRVTEIWKRWKSAIKYLGPLLEGIPQVLILSICLFIAGLVDTLFSASQQLPIGAASRIYAATSISAFSFVIVVAIVLFTIWHSVVHYHDSPFTSNIARIWSRRKEGLTHENSIDDNDEAEGEPDDYRYAEEPDDQQLAYSEILQQTFDDSLMEDACIALLENLRKYGSPIKDVMPVLNLLLSPQSSGRTALSASEIIRKIFIHLSLLNDQLRVTANVYTFNDKRYISEMCSNIIERLNLIVSKDSQLLWWHTHTVAFLSLHHIPVGAPSGGPHGPPFSVLWRLHSEYRWDPEGTSMRDYICMLYEATTALCNRFSCQGSVTKETEHPLHDVISQAIEWLPGESSSVVNTGLLLWSAFQELADKDSGKPHWHDSFFSALLRRSVMNEPVISSIQNLQSPLSLDDLISRNMDWYKRKCIRRFFISHVTTLAVQHTSSEDLDPPEIQLISALGDLWDQTDGDSFGYTRSKFDPAEMIYLRWKYAFPFTILICLPEELGRKILQRVWKKRVQTENNKNWLSLFEEIVKGQWDSFFNELRKSDFQSWKFLMLFLVGEDGKTLDPDFRRVMVEVYPDRPMDYYDKPYDFAVEKKTSRLLKRYYQEHILVHDPPSLVLDPTEENHFIISPFHEADSQPAVDTNENEVVTVSSRSAVIVDMGSSST